MDDVSKYAHSPVHIAVLHRDYTSLTRIIESLPKLAKPGEVTNETESILAEVKANELSHILDRRDVPGRETPLHLAIRLRDAKSAEILMLAGANWSLQNENGWNALQEAVCAKEEQISLIIARQYQPLAWAKWCRRLPRIVATMSRVRDFYMEISFSFESSVIPFIGRIAPSDTYRIWKRGSNLRADMTLAGFDGFRIQRSDQTFLFLGEGNLCLPKGSLIVLSHKKKEIVNALEGAGCQPSENEVKREVALMAETNLYRPGIDVTKAEVVPHLNWRRQERCEMVGKWKAKVFDMVNVMVSVKSRRVPGALTDEEVFSVDDCEKVVKGADQDDFGSLTDEERKQLDSALRMVNSDGLGDNPSEVGKEKKSWFGANNKSSKNGKGKDKISMKDGKKGVLSEFKTESEYKKGLRPVLWLTSDFPLQTEELLPLLDILADKVKAVRRLRELLTTKLPPGTFPVKVAIPIVPTVKVVVTFTKFEEFQPTEEFVTPPSSPTHFQDSNSKPPDGSTLWVSWIKGARGGQSSDEDSPTHHYMDETDPFAIPADYTWVDAPEKKRRMNARKAKNKKNHKPTPAF